MILHAALLVFAGLMVFAAWKDVSTYTIPNWIPAALVLAFPIAALAAGLGWAGAGLHLAAGAAALLLGMALYAPGWIGGGDAKLFAAIVLWTGWPGAGEFTVKALILGGGLAIALLLLRRLAPSAGVPAGWTRGTPLAAGAPVPYGLALAAGALWTLPNTPLAAALAG